MLLSIYSNLPFSSSSIELSQRERVYTISQIEHDLDGISTVSTCFKGFFYLPLGESEPVGYQGLHINLTTPQEL
uniref:Uncharacterized protein n=1 Tax=Rhizophora mucronata TaxID=61149 RepID=A0A2P2LWX9_RHIMU